MAKDKSTEKTSIMKFGGETGEQKLTRIGKLKDAMEHAEVAIKEMADLLSDDLPPPVMARAYHVLNYGWKKDIEKMQKVANEGIKGWVVDNAQALGTQERTETGGESWKIPLDAGREKFEAVVIQSRATQPSVDLLAEVLKKKREARGKQVSLEKCKEDITVEEISRVYSADKVAQLVQKGVLKKEDVDEARPLGSRSLKVNKL